MPAPISAGRPNNIQTLRDMEAADLADGKGISADEAKKLVKTAKTDAEKTVVRQMLERDGFDTDLDAKKAGKLLGGKAVNRSPALDVKLDGAKVLRTFGPTDGYLDKSQAIGAAVLAHTPNAAVVQDANGHWHAVETDKPITGKQGENLGVHPGDASAEIATFRDLAANDKSRTDPATIDAAKKLAAKQLGIPESEINICWGVKGMVAGKVNVNINSNADGAEGRTKGDAADKNGVVPSYIHIAALTHGSQHAGTTLFHEGTHASDYERVNQWKAKYDALSPKPKETFGQWLNKQVKAGKLDATDRTRMEDLQMNSSLAKETHAHLNAFMQAFRSTNYADAIGELNQLGAEGANKDLAKLNAPELRAFYDTLAPWEQKTFASIAGKLTGQAKAVFDEAFPGGFKYA